MAPDLQLALAWRGLVVRVDGAPAGMAAWLAGFFGPSFAASDLPASAEATVTVTVENGAPAPPSGDVECFTGDEAHVRLPRIGPAAARDELSGATLHVTASGAHVTVPGDDRKTRVFVMRVVRELMTAHAADDLHIHAAAVATERGAILFVGPRGAGKTTLLLYALGQPDVALVANDRVFVDARTGVARGMPTILSVRPGSLDLVTGMAPRVAALSLPAGPAQLGVPVVAAAPVARVVLVEPVRSASGFALTLAPHARLGRDVLIARGSTAALFRRAAAKPVEERLAAIAARVPIAHLVLGPDAFRTSALWQALSKDAEWP